MDRKWRDGGYEVIKRVRRNSLSAIHSLLLCMRSITPYAEPPAAYSRLETRIRGLITTKRFVDFLS